MAPSRAHEVGEALRQLVDARPSHPAVLPLLDAGVRDGHPFLVFSTSSGLPLDAALQAYGPAALPDALPRLAELAAALDAVARRAGGHGALTPADIVIDGDRTWLTGVGVAGALARAGVELMLDTTYAPPERVTGGKGSSADDQYALAVIACEWCFGKVPARDSSRQPVLPPSAGKHPPAFARAFAQALASDPSARFPTSTAFVSALQASVAPPRRAALPFEEEGSGGLLSAAATLVGRADPPLHAAGEHMLDNGTTASPIDRLATAHALRPDDAAALENFPLAQHADADSPRLASDLSLGEPVTAPSWQPAPRSSPLPLVGTLLLGMIIGAGVMWWLLRAVDAPPLVTAEARDSTVAPAAPAAAPVPAPRTSQTTAAATGLPATQPPTTRASTTPPTTTSRTSDTRTASGAALPRTEPPSLPGRATPPTTARATSPVTTAARAAIPPPASPRTSATAAVPPPAVAAEGSLVVDSLPSGATVFVDGVRAGITPMTLTSVAPGEHSVRIELVGFTPVSASVAVKAGERARVAARLEGGPQQR